MWGFPLTALNSPAACAISARHSLLGGVPSLALRLAAGCALACGSVWLERCVRDAEAGGSNPLTPTNLNQRGVNELQLTPIFFLANPLAAQRCAKNKALPFSRQRKVCGTSMAYATRLGDDVSPFVVRAVLSTIAVQQRGGRAEISTAFSRKDALHIRRGRCKKTSPPQTVLNLALNYTE